MVFLLHWWLSLYYKRHPIYSSFSEMMNIVPVPINWLCPHRWYQHSLLVCIYDHVPNLILKLLVVLLITLSRVLSITLSRVLSITLSPSLVNIVPSLVDNIVPSLVNNLVPSLVNNIVPSLVDNLLLSLVDNIFLSLVDHIVPSLVNDILPPSKMQHLTMTLLPLSLTVPWFLSSIDNILFTIKDILSTQPFLKWWTLPQFPSISFVLIDYINIHC